MFVTWKTAIGHHLRGCIGTTQPVQLVEGLKVYALKSALNDSRFTPITADELPNLVCTVSLLIDFEECSDFRDWNIGSHGVSIKYLDESKNKTYHALFLPEVMVEHGKYFIARRLFLFCRPGSCSNYKTFAP